MVTARYAGVRRSAVRRLVAVTAAALLIAGAGLLVRPAQSAHADTRPPSGWPATVSVDALPTVQINGVVWSQVTVGNTVYATGSFSSARPAGSPAGTNEVPRGNLLAFDLTTGVLSTSFNHTLNAQGRVITASPDGSRIYVGGDFTQVDGQTHNRIAAFSTSTGALVSGFLPSSDAGVRAIAATNSTVYFGGAFSTVNGHSRAHLAAVAASNGALTAWAPKADAAVFAMVFTPDQSRVVVGGQFATLNGVAAKGLGALNPSTGATLSWAANQLVQDYGSNSAIDFLRTDGSQVYGGGYVFGTPGNLEGMFAADPDSGTIHWIEDCHGDTYDAFPVGQVAYVVSHEHFCGNIGAWPQTTPWTYHRSTAFTTYKTGTISHNTITGYHDWYGNPRPSQVDWYPDLAVGSYTGQNQAAWSTTGNASYLALGGEFPSVNGTAQQGLVRFAISSLAPNKVGPKYSDSLTPTVFSPSAGTVRVSWTGTYDQDNQILYYALTRRDSTNTVTTTCSPAAASTFWQLPAMACNNLSVTPGATYSYRVTASDPFSNSTTASNTSFTVPSTPVSQYASDVLAAGPSDIWRLGESSGTVGYNSAGINDQLEGAGVTFGAPGAIAGDSSTATTFDGASDGYAGSKFSFKGPNTFTEEAWFKTTSTTGGKIIGFGSSQSGLSGGYDRQIYLDNAGHVIFGVYTGTPITIASGSTFRDGRYHLVDATLSSGGMLLYVDGRLVARNTSVTAGQAFTGYWRIGGDNLTGWPSRPTSFYLAGTLDEVAVYPKVLTATQIMQHYTDSGL